MNQLLFTAIVTIPLCAMPSSSISLSHTKKTLAVHEKNHGSPNPATTKGIVTSVPRKKEFSDLQRKHSDTKAEEQAWLEDRRLSLTHHKWYSGNTTTRHKQLVRSPVCGVSGAVRDTPADSGSQPSGLNTTPRLHRGDLEAGGLATCCTLTDRPGPRYQVKQCQPC